MPRVYFRERARELGEPELTHIQTLHTECDTSMEATARRYVCLSDYPCAVVFAKDRNVRYFATSPELPYHLDIKPRLPLPKQSRSYESGAGLGDWEEIDAWVWLTETKGLRLPDTMLEQTLWQERGYKIILLFLDSTLDQE